MHWTISGEGGNVGRKGAPAHREDFTQSVLGEHRVAGKQAAYIHVLLAALQDTTELRRGGEALGRGSCVKAKANLSDLTCSRLDAPSLKRPT